jgi:hypothetical protein
MYTLREGYNFSVWIQIFPYGHGAIKDIKASLLQRKLGKQGNVSVCDVHMHIIYTYYIYV